MGNILVYYNFPIVIKKNLVIGDMVIVQKKVVEEKEKMPENELKQNQNEEEKICENEEKLNESLEEIENDFVNELVKFNFASYLL